MIHPARNTLTSRVRTGQPYTENLLKTIDGLFAEEARLQQTRASIAGDPSLSDIGRNNKLADAVKGDLAHVVARHGRAVRKALWHVASERAAMKPPDVDPTDVLGELRRQEIRAHLRSLPVGERQKVAIEFSQDNDYIAAITDAPPSLSGLDQQLHRSITTDYVERTFGPRLKELKGIEDDYTNAKGALDIVRGKLQEASGFSPSAFEEFMQPLEAAADAE